MRRPEPSRGPTARGRVLLAVATVGVLLSAGAGPGGATEPVDAARIVDGYDCLAPNLAGWMHPPDATGTADPEHPDARDAGRVPDGFTPTTAVWCDLSASIEDDEGLWNGVTAVTLAGDLAPLLDALAEPDDATGWGACTADLEIVSPLWLVDASGGAIHAHYPRDRCGKTKPGAHDALAALTVGETTSHKRALVTPRAALDSSCAAEWTAPFDELLLLAVPSTDEVFGADGAATATSTPMTAPTPTAADGMRWCRYSVEAEPAEAPQTDVEALFPDTVTLRTGTFVAGGTLDPTLARPVADVAAAGSAPRTCETPATVFLVLRPTLAGQDLGTVLTAELDGCELLYLDTRSPRPLPAELSAVLAARTAP